MSQSDILRKAAEALSGNVLDQLRGHLIDGATEIEELTQENKQLRENVETLRDHVNAARTELLQTAQEGLSLHAEIEKLRAGVQEWLCDKCNTVYPGPPQPGFSCVQCPACKGQTGPRQTIEILRLMGALESIEITSLAVSERVRQYARKARMGHRLAGPDDLHQAMLDEATKPLHVKIEQLQKERDKAVRTLEQSGYTDCGGELWKPPLGKAPQFEEIDRLRAALERIATPGMTGVTGIARSALYSNSYLGANAAIIRGHTNVSSMSGTIHELKCWKAEFDAIARGEKTFELRRNDRGFKFGDILRLREWRPQDGIYTGRELARKITYKLDGPCVFGGLESGHCILGLSVESSTEPHVIKQIEHALDDCNSMIPRSVSNYIRGCIADYRKEAPPVHPDPTGQTREPTPDRLLTIWKTVQKITDELARADCFSGETIKELVEAADYLLCYHHILFQRLLHPDPTGKTREPPHCPTCGCGDAQTRVDTAAFKNFHRLLCERFGYGHDERDWRRDQLSLIEHIAKCRLDAEYEQVGVLNCSYEGFTTCEGASGEPVYRKRKSL